MKSNKVHLQYFGTCRAHGKLWFSNLGFNSLFSLNLQDLSIEYRHRISFLDNEHQGAYMDQCCSYGSKLFFFPTNCRRIMVYDTEQDSIQEIAISLTDDSELYGTMGIIQWKEQIWIFPRKLKNGIFILNLKTLQLKRDLELCRILSEIEEIYSVIGLGQARIAILSQDNTIIQIDMQSKRDIYIKHFKDCIDIWAIKYDGNNFWLLPIASTDIYEWDQTKDKLTKYYLVETEWLTTVGGVPYSNMVFLDDHIIILPCRLKYIMKINRETHTIMKAVEYPPNFRFLNNQFALMNAWPAFTAFDIIDNKIFVHPMLGNMLLVYDVEKNHMEGIELVVTNNDVPFLEEILEARFRIEDIFYEVEDGGNLEIFLNMIMDQENNCCNKTVEKSVGEEIYYAILK